MYLSATLIIAALSSFAEANPTLSSGVAIPITKRTQVRSANGVVDVARLQGGIHHTIAFVFSTISIQRTLLIIGMCLENFIAASRPTSRTLAPVIPLLPK